MLTESDFKKQPKLFPQPSRSQRWGWYLFDFANSILIINGSLYFPQWLVIDNGVSGSTYNMVALLISLFLICTAPYFGAQADERGECFRFLWITSSGLFISGLALGIGGLYIPMGDLRNNFCLLCFGGVLYFYQLSLVFYNALLKPLSQDDTASKISGIGLAWGWIGGIVAVLAIDPVVKGHLFFHTANRMNAILPSTLAFGALTALSLFLIRNLDRPKLSPNRHQSIFGLFRDLKGYPILLSFLLAFFLYSDAILTIENNVTIFMEKVFGTSDDGKAIAFMAFLFLAALAAGTEWNLNNRYKSLRTLFWCLLAWIGALVIACLASSAWIFYACFLMMGVLYGILYNASRVFFFQLIPKEKIAEYFGLYASFERFASIIGPLLWSLPLMARAHEDATGYQQALGMMILPMFLSVGLLGYTHRQLDRT